MRTLAAIRDLLPTRIILVTLAFMVLVHMVVLTFYTQHHQVTHAVAQRNNVIQQVMNIIHMVEATPASQLENAIAALQEPNIVAAVTLKPIYETQVNVLSIWRINKLVPQNANTLELSLHLTDNRWLNIQAEITHAEWVVQLFLLSIEILVVCIVLFYLWSINRFTQPLKKFQLAAEQLGVNINAPTTLQEYDGPPIVRDTAQAMNTMQTRIRDLLNDRTLLLAAISHDLRTPITRMKLRANKVVDPEIYTKTMADLTEMETMISEILAFARDDKGTEKKNKLDLNSFLQAICDEFTDVGYPVTYHGSDNRIPFLASPLSMKRAISNLLKNAITYGNCAEVTLTRQQDRSIITIEDQGPGIPEAELEKVFSPFYRCDQSRSRDIAGSGLGLATAKDTIIAHSGSITLENMAHGLRVTVMLPIA